MDSESSKTFISREQIFSKFEMLCAPSFQFSVRVNFSILNNFDKIIIMIVGNFISSQEQFYGQYLRDQNLAGEMTLEE
jgi:hypothetical protein